MEYRHFLHKRRAFTAVETLLTIGVIAVTAGLSIPMYRNYQIRGDLDIATEQTIQALRRAQLLSQAGEQDSQWGFYVRDGILFQGEQYALRDPNFDEEYPFPPTINTSGLSEVVFSRVYGVPQETGEITLEGLNGDQRIIIVSADGILTPSTNMGDDFFSDTDDSAVGEIDGGVDGVEGGIDGDSDGGTTGEDDGDTGGADGTTGGDTGGDDGDTGGDGGTGGGGGDDDDEVATCEDRFAVAADGTVETTGTVDVTFKVLGSQITYGAGGPEVQVRVYASTDGGDNYTALFGENDVDGGEEQTISNLITGKQITLKFNARYSWYYNNTYESNDGTGHVEVLRNGDDPPDYAPFGNQNSLANFLQDIIDDNGKIDIGEYDAVALAELGSSLSSSSSDFQDAVVLMKFNQQAGACADSYEPKFKVEYDRLENYENGDMEESVYVGGGPIAFAESQWIPLKNNGTTITDSGMVEVVPGLASQRGNGYVRILLHGSHPSNGSREVVDARIVFDGVNVVNVVNDTGTNATENPFDGVVNDGSGGDEVTIASNSKSVLYQTRVTTADDGIYIYWVDTGDAGSGDDGDTTGGDDASDDSGDEGSSSSAGGDDGSSSSAGNDSGDTADGGDGGDDTPDPCGAAYTISDNGAIVLGEDADVTFEILGSYSTYGDQGPEVQVRLNASTDGGLTWRSLFGYRDVDGEESETLSDVPAGSELVFQAEGRYSWLFRSIALSDDGSGRVRLIKRGGAVPGTTPFSNPLQLRRFLRTQISNNGIVAVGKRELLALVELQDLDNNSDFQDVVMKIILEKPASQGICGASADSGTDGGDEGGEGNASCSSTCQLLNCSNECGLLSGGICGCIDDEGGTDEDEQYTICHYPPGNPRNSTTLTVNGSAWVAHRSHGDTLGSCEEDRDDDGVVNSEDLCPDTFLPEDVPESGLMYFNRYALTHNNFAFRVGPRKKVSEFTLADTRGCSCGQMVDVAEGSREYRFNQYPRLLRQMRSLFPFYTEGARNFGCGIAIMRMIEDSR